MSQEVSNLQVSLGDDSQELLSQVSVAHIEESAAVLGDLMVLISRVKSRDERLRLLRTAAAFFGFSDHEVFGHQPKVFPPTGASSLSWADDAEVNLSPKPSSEEKKESPAPIPPDKTPEETAKKNTGSGATRRAAFRKARRDFREAVKAGDSKKIQASLRRLKTLGVNWNENPKEALEAILKDESLKEVCEAYGLSTIEAWEDLKDPPESQ